MFLVDTSTHFCWVCAQVESDWVCFESIETAEQFSKRWTCVLAQQQHRRWFDMALAGFFILAVLVDVGWDLIVVFTLVFLMTNDIEHL